MGNCVVSEKYTNAALYLMINKGHFSYSLGRTTKHIIASEYGRCTAGDGWFRVQKTRPRTPNKLESFLLELKPQNTPHRRFRVREFVARNGGVFGGHGERHK